MIKGWRRWGYGAIALLLVFGIGIRILHLDRKVYWHDEVFTSLRVAGYLGSAVEADVFTGESLTAADLLTYQRLSPERSWRDTLTALADHPEHTPLYYLLARGWVSLWGSSVAAFRSLSVVFSLLALPCGFLLARTLLGPGLASWLFLGLLAVSPVHVLYGQEAREYSLWVLTIILSSTALLQAVKPGRSWHWVSYSLTLALGFYASLLTGLVALAHGVYLVLTQRSRQWLGYLAAGCGALMLLSPWLGVMLVQWMRLETVTAWTAESRPWDFLAKLWGLHYSAAFVDPGLPLEHPYTYIAPPLIGVLLLLSSMGLLNRQPYAVSAFVLCLTLVPGGILILTDLLRSGQISGTTRYFFPALIGAQLLVAQGLASLLTAPTALSRQVGRVLTIALLVAGGTSCLISAQAYTWWSKGVSYANPFIADYINQAPQPLIMGHSYATALGDAISLSYDLEPDTSWRLTRLPQMPVPSADAETIFLFKPRQDFLEAAAHAYSAAPQAIDTDRVYGLWQLPTPSLPTTP
ncbi:hypothetical protein XM38_015690 [Halomicronema hongdechloris C2206]|uniref:Glycosyltransferase RgtA/B/C/D-like domain-containing protein n=1 Tax=Halomicronema hongdechloris C2206 TaxID=1641165 RepID=A0A1Z3HJZ0_9CYAN|nr:glycosyltransferase family 39 protein [Halomicronema hongdechloris]ASC70629.1 hypothetical protein XM38_015690 [Halomicronema hongdechloris C2206]